MSRRAALPEDPPEATEGPAAELVGSGDSPLGQGTSDVELPRATGWTAFAGALLEREIARVRTESERPHGDDPDSVPTIELLETADRRVAAAEQDFDTALDDGPFAAVVAAAELEALPARVLGLCAAVESDRRLQRLIGLLVHDTSAGRVTIELLERLLGPEAVDCLTDDSRLICAALLEPEAGPPFAAAQIVVPRRVTWALRGDLSLDPELPPDSEILVAPAHAFSGQPLVLVHGEDRVRRTQAAVLSTAGLAFLATSAPPDDAAWRVLVRQATVAGLGVVLDLGAGGELDPVGRHWVERADHLAWALCSRHLPDVATLPRGTFAEVAAAPPQVVEDEWRAALPSVPPPNRWPSAEQLWLAQRVSRPTDSGQEAVRRVVSGLALHHARRVVPRAGWDDLVLPTAQERQLRALVDRYQQRSRVHEDWGLPLFPSPGVVTLFSGPSGTGKTTTAEVIAHELGIDLFRVDLSALVSKYIGETEKNLEQIFSAAHAGDYLLLFDEADALFGSRSKVSDARDRYANMEVSYLLQRLESYDGFVVLTSNFQGNIDPAFLRRIHLTVHFPVPSAEDRERIWARSLGQAPTDDLDLSFISRQFDLTGGSIRNAALTAAFDAAGGSGRIGMAELLRAIGSEMTKLGRRVNDEQFGRWLADIDT